MRIFGYYWFRFIVFMYGYKTIEGIKVSETKNIERKQEFYRSTESALSFLKQHDHRRFTRVVSYIEHIYNDYYRTPACFLPKGKRCLLDSHFFPEEGRDRDLYIAWILVHEATHGLLHQRGIGYTKKTKFRIENACFQEQTRFINSLGDSISDEWKEYFMQINFSNEQVRKNYSKTIIYRIKDLKPVIRRIQNDEW